MVANCARAEAKEKIR